MNRREFIAGIGTAVAAAAIPLPPLTEFDPLVRAIIYQSWPFNEPRPEFWHSGQIGSQAPDASRFLLSKVLRSDMTYYKIIV